MHYRLKSLSLATATLLLSVTSPLLPLTWKFEPLVAQAQTSQDRKAEALRLYEEGRQQLNRGQFREALQTFQQILVIFREIGDRQGEAYSLGGLGTSYHLLGQYQQAIESYQQALAIQGEIGERQGEAYLLRSLGSIYHILRQYKEAIAVYQQWLTIAREISDSQGEIYSLGGLGINYQLLGQYQQAIESYQQVLAIQRKIGDRQGEAYLLRSLGEAYVSLGQYKEAIEVYQQCLAITRELGDRQGEIYSLWGVGIAYDASGQYKEAIEVYQQSLAIAQELGDFPGKMGIQLYLDNAYVALGQYKPSHLYRNQIEQSQQMLANARKLGERRQEGTALQQLGSIYAQLKQYKEAIEFYQQALTNARKLGERHWESDTLHSLGFAYYSLGQYREAIEFYRQSLAITREMEDRVHSSDRLGDPIILSNQRRGIRTRKAYTLSNLGNAYYSLRQYREAIEFYQQALATAREIEDRSVEGYPLSNLGNAYYSLGQYREAIEFYQQALAIAREIENRGAEGRVLSDIGKLLAQQDQPELAIVFYKQSVNIAEAARRNIRGWSQKHQQTFTETVAGSYRALADLLFKQDRVLEAQQVLDLLKVQELDDYLDDVRGNNNIAQGLPNLPPEQQTWTSYQTILNKAVEIGKELTQLRQLKQQNGKLTPAQEQRIDQLVKAQETIMEEFNNFTRSPEVLALVTQRSPETLSQDLLLRMGDFNALQDNLRNLQQNAVLLYPLILDDRTELILTTPDSPPIRRTVSVTKQQLNETIAAFRSALQDPSSDAKAPAQQLYNWLIKPLEAELEATDTQTIIYAPDAQLRYIPLAALYDGEQWLVQRYRINNITAASLTDLNTKPQRKMQVLAGAFATGRYSFTVGGESFDFAGLPFAGTEVENLAKTVPATTKFIDKAFTPQVTVPKMDDYTVVHLATHAAFVVGTPDDSFILFGNGDLITLRDIQKWSLKNVDLVVLSACETGLGGKLGNGEEILGLGYQMQRAGARAVVASLWSVDDGGTQALMNALYANLKKDNTTKAEALRQAQIALITSDDTALGQERGIFGVEYVRDSSSRDAIALFSHPYYWAPFILIGNGL